jgi:BirA family biotin operon repressor/biotin-[acetyl-CoA-carboxylase] ligase
MRWPAEAIWEAIAPLLPGFTVEILPEIDSTNTELMRRARAGQAEPVLLVAETQTAGRGRLGRGWHSAPGASLTFSLGLPLAPADWSGLSLAVGVSLAGSLHPVIGLKWPNDLWWEQRKLAGILIETAAIGSQRHAVIGIGVNIAPPPTQEGLSTPAAALQDLLPGIDAPGTLLKIAEPLVRTLLAFEQTGFSPFAARFQLRDVLEGREVVLSDGPAGHGPGRRRNRRAAGAYCRWPAARHQFRGQRAAPPSPLKAESAMLRLIVLLLLLANGLYFAWSHGLLQAYGLAPVQQAEPQRLSQQLHPERVRLLGADEVRRLDAPTAQASAATATHRMPASRPLRRAPGHGAEAGAGYRTAAGELGVRERRGARALDRLHGQVPR